MAKTFFVDYPCLKCGRTGMMNYFPAGHQGIHHSFIICGNCQVRFEAGDKHWREMLAARVERPE